MALVKEFDELLEIMHRLRHECPWDKEQNLQTLRRYLLEEAYECVAAINEIPEHGLDPVIEEVGDVLLQVLFQSELLSEELKRPAMQLVMEGLKSKLIRRHPHVFGDQEAKNAEAVLKRWDEIKKSEKKQASSSALEGVSKSMTALQLAQKFGDRSKKVQFDWKSAKEVWSEGVESEMNELLAASTTDEKEDELGDLLFSLVQWARHEGIDAETALARTNRKFEKRFKAMEAAATSKKQNFPSLTIQEKEDLWRQAKELEKK